MSNLWSAIHNRINDFYSLILFIFKISLMLLAPVSFASNINAYLLNFDRCTNTHLANQAPYFQYPKIKEFRHFENGLLSALFKPNHVIDDLILNQHDPVTLHARLNYDVVLHKDLKDEYVHVSLYQEGALQWVYLGKYKTNFNGEVFIPLNLKLEVGDYLIRMVVEGDGSSVDGFTSIVSSQHEAIVFDIDGTLTLSDFELVKDYLELATATPYYFASQVLDSYDQKGYELIFLTARPYWLAPISRFWLNSIFSEGWPLKTKNSLLSPEGTAQYKANYLKQLIQEKNLKIARAYGNAMTDIEAYALAGIPKKNTFIIGPNAGKNGTNPIYNNYFNHFFEVVASTPEAHCKSN